jgi:hypothetical protein
MANQVKIAAFVANIPRAQYNDFRQGCIVGPRSYFQPLAGQDASKVTSGLDLFLRSGNVAGGDGAYARVYAWFTGTLTWQPGSASAPGDRLLLTKDILDPQIFRRLRMLEAAPGTAIYENVDGARVRVALEKILRDAYPAARDEKDQAKWHPAMRVQLRVPNAKNELKPVSIRNWLNGQLPNNGQGYVAPPEGTEDAFSRLVRRFLGESPADTPAVEVLAVNAGERIGEAAPYLAADPLPAATWIGTSGDGNRARRLTFRVVDQWGQTINPLYYHAICWRHVRDVAVAKNRIVDSITDIVQPPDGVAPPPEGRTLDHPLVSLCGAIATGEVPRAREREQPTGTPPPAPVTPVPLTQMPRRDPANTWRFLDLGDWHGFPLEAAEKQSRYEWRYGDDLQFEARDQNKNPVSFLNQDVFHDRIVDLWNRPWLRPPLPPPPGQPAPSAPPAAKVGDAISIISEALQVPCELVFAIIGAEAAPVGYSGANWRKWNTSSIRFEPLTPWQRNSLRSASPSVTDDVQLLYDKCFGTPVVVKSVQPADKPSLKKGTSKVVIELQERTSWRLDLLGSIPGGVLLVGDVARLKVKSNTKVSSVQPGAPKQQATLTIVDDSISGGFTDATTQVPPSSGSPVTWYYRPDQTAAGSADANTGWFEVTRDGAIRVFEVTSGKSEIDVDATVTVRHKESSQAISLTVKPAGGRVAGTADTLNVSKGNHVRIEVTLPATAMPAAALRRVAWVLLFTVRADQSAWALDGWSPSSWPSSWPDQRDDDPVRPNDPDGQPRAPSPGLTFRQLQRITSVVSGANVSPGMMQTLISTFFVARDFLLAARPDIFQLLQIAVPSSDAGELLKQGWLLDPAHSALAGAAFLRIGYNGIRFGGSKSGVVGATRFDIPPVAAAYNSQNLTPDPSDPKENPWAITGVKGYPDSAGPSFNAALDAFDEGVLSPPPPVRFRR